MYSNCYCIYGRWGFTCWCDYRYFQVVVHMWYTCTQCTRPYDRIQYLSEQDIPVQYPSSMDIFVPFILHKYCNNNKMHKCSIIQNQFIWYEIGLIFFYQRSIKIRNKHTFSAMVFVQEGRIDTAQIFELKNCAYKLYRLNEIYFIETSNICRVLFNIDQTIATI